MSSLSTVKTENGKVTCETPEGMVINININQRSCLDSLLDAIKHVRMAKKDGPDNKPVKQITSKLKPAKETTSIAFLGVGVSFMSLGIVSIMLAIILQVANVDLYLMTIYKGTHFWLGIPFLVAGILNIVAYKYPKALWVAIAMISLLVCMAVSITGMVFVTDDLNSFWWRWRAEMGSRCDDLRKTQNDDYRPNPTRYYNPYYERDNNFKLEYCKRSFQQYQYLLFGLLIMSLLMTIWGLCLSALTLAYKLKVFFTACRYEKVEEEKDDPLLSANPTPNIIIA